MERKQIFIADSGGSKTDWCLIDASGILKRFTTASYHPRYWTEEFFEKERRFWLSQDLNPEFELKFFGAGCLDEQNASYLKGKLEKFGFGKVEVKSDLHAAAHALLGNEDGFFAILGTGSVAAEIRNGEIKQLFGGLGYLLGDEGSGYHFGKLLLKGLLSGELQDQQNQLFELLGDRAMIMREVYGENGKEYLTSMSKLTNQHAVKGLEKVHMDNLQSFLSTLPLSEIDKISCAGSYAFHQEEQLREVFKKSGIQLEKVIERPIIELSEYFLRTSF